MPVGVDDPSDFLLGRRVDESDASDEQADRDDSGDDDEEEEEDEVEAADDKDARTDAPDLERRYNEATDERVDAETDDDDDEDNENEHEDDSSNRVLFFVTPDFCGARSILRAQRSFVPGFCASYTSPNEPSPSLRINVNPRHDMFHVVRKKKLLCRL